MATETTATLLTELIPSEDIDSFIAGYAYTQPVGQAVAWVRPSPLGSVAVRFPRWNQLGSGVPAGTKTEGTGAFTRKSIDTTEDSLTPGLVGYELVLTDEAVAGSPGGMEAGLIVECINALVDRMDSDVLSGSTSATLTTGAITDDFTHAKFAAAAAAYRANKIPGGMVAFVGHNDAFRDLTASIGSSAAPFQANQALLDMFGPGTGYHGTYLGFQMFESANVAAETTGWSNFMTPMGQGGGLGLALKEPPNVTASRAEQSNSYAYTHRIFRCWYAGGIVNATRILEVLSRT